jgi:L-gulonate 3-dehydrogenase
MSSQKTTTVAIIGGGSIGVAFAVVFTRAGWNVRLYDPDAGRRERIADEVTTRLTQLSGFGLLAEAVEVLIDRLQVVETIADAVADADLVEECAPEQLAIKRELFRALDEAAPPQAILASASSAMTASSFAENLAGRHRCLVAHPGNPPYLIPLIELVPASFTSDEVVERARALFEHSGLRPILVRKEVEGFVFNRLQGALLREAYCLVRDGVARVDEIDTVVRDGLGLRWAVVGPFETVDLNTRGGIESHAKKMGPAYARMGAERGQHDPWTDELVASVASARRELLPIEHWEDRVAWRDRRLMALTRERSDAGLEESDH